jgi:CRISPR-associated protein Cas5h
MEVLVFDLIGKMAHFRQYYTNSSSLSYFFPPRTTVTGIIAGVIGLSRDSYYEIFSEDTMRIALAIRSPLRKKIQTVNYIWAENRSQLNLSAGQHTQVPMELVLPGDYREFIVYRVFLWHRDSGIFSQIAEAVVGERICFPPYLGISECLGYLKFAFRGEAEEKFFNGMVEVNSVVGVEYFKKYGCFLEPREGALYVKELMPFTFDAERRLRSAPREFVGEVRSGRIYLKGSGKVYAVRGDDREERIIFIED